MAEAESKQSFTPNQNSAQSQDSAHNAPAKHASAGHDAMPPGTMNGTPRDERIAGLEMGVDVAAMMNATGDLDTRFYNLLLSPMLKEMQSTVEQNNEILDDILNKMKDEREVNRKKQLSAHIPLQLQGRGRDVQEIIKHVENFISYENYDMEETDVSKFTEASLHELDSHARLAVIGHSVSSYVSTLDSSHLKHIANKIVTDVTVWLSIIFRFPGASAHMHEGEREGLARIANLAIHRRYPKYATDGYEVLYPRPPVIYMSAAAKHNLGQQLCHQLGLPLSCVCTVPCVVGRMNVDSLHKLMEDDISSGKVPVLVISFAGTPLLGRVDNISRLSEICRQHDVWLHLEGSSLTMLAASSLPSYLTSAPLANSLTLNLGAWLALPAVPFVTLFRSPDVMLTRAASLSTFNVRYKLNCVSLWMCTVSLGHDNILARLHYHTHLATVLHDRIAQISTTNELILLEIESPCVILRYQRKVIPDHNAATSHTTESQSTVPNSTTTVAITTGLTSNNNTDKDQYFETLNIWLVETLKREVPEIHVAAVELEGVGLCIRYAPLETSYVSPSSLFDVTLDSVDRFIACLERNVEILDATVSMKKDFEDIVRAQDNMALVHLPSWAGLGAVQYVPDSLLKVSSLSEMTVQSKHEINVLNHEIVSQLKSSDTAFSVGQTEGGLYCVRFGLVTDDTDLEELIAMVYTTGKDVEESSKFIQTMADVVKHGIEQAALDLEKENQDKLLQEGVLRQVPLVGSLINWWSPPAKDPIKGRTFNLASGKMISTEDTYKYHMQIQEASPASPAVQQKVREGPLKASLKPAHSKRVPEGQEVSSEGQETPSEGQGAAGEQESSVGPIDGQAVERSQLIDGPGETGVPSTDATATENVPTTGVPASGVPGSTSNGTPVATASS